MAARIAARCFSRRLSSGGKVLSEEEKAAENVYIKKMEQEKLEKMAHKGSKPGEAATPAKPQQLMQSPAHPQDHHQLAPQQTQSGTMVCLLAQSLLSLLWAGIYFPTQRNPKKWLTNKTSTWFEENKSPAHCPHISRFITGFHAAKFACNILILSTLSSELGFNTSLSEQRSKIPFPATFICCVAFL